MKLRYLLISLILFSASSFAQKVYPLKTIKEVQYRSDEDLKAGKQSAAITDTVRIRGIALHSTLRDPNNSSSQPMIFCSSTSKYVLFVQDSSSDWAGMQVYQEDQNSGTELSTVDSAQYVEFTGYAKEYFTSTEFIVISKPVAIPINKLDQLPSRPAAKVMQISDFTSGGVMDTLAEKYEDMYVEFRNVRVSDRSTSDGSFKINDGNGNQIYMYAQNGYNAIGGYKFKDYNDYILPQNGARLDYIRGVIQDRWSGTITGYTITPLYPDDIAIGSQPPTVSKLKRNTDLVGRNQAVDLTASILPQKGGSIKDVKVYYRINGGSYSSVPMTKTADTTIFKATVPGIEKDSALVDYYVWAQDNDNQVSYFPADTGKSNYFYMVLNRPVTIRDVQYSPFGSGFNAFSGYKVTLTGVVTADTSDIPGTDNTYLELQRIFMQDGSAPWSGIWVYGIKTLQVKVGNDTVAVKRGDKITVSGMIIEDYNLTRLDSISSITITSSNNPVPDPVELLTSDIAVKPNGTVDAEKYEGMLVRYKNVTVLKDNADDNTAYNDAEMLVADQSGVGTRVKLGDGAGTYHNGWNTAVGTRPNWTKISKGDKFSSITGVLLYTGGNYKIVPRKNDDYQGYTTGVETVNNQPKRFGLQQNYPNPFNPSTTIEYSIPKEGMVTLKIFNLMGQEVKTLVNQFQNGGTYKASFDASGMPSGIYFYQLNSGSLNSVKKMLLLK